MKAQPVLRVRRRIIYSPQAPRVSRRKWFTLVTVGILLAIVVTTVGAFALGGTNRMAGPSVASNMYYPEDQSQMKLDPYATGMRDSDYLGAYMQGTGTTAQGWDRMIIRTATVNLTVKDVSAAIERVKAITLQQGGYVFSSESHEQGEYTYATVTVYVPAKEFDQIMPILRGLDGQVEKVTSENVTSSDVTEEYTDLQSQMRNLKATEARMLDLQTRATELDDVLAVDRELRSVQGEIEMIQGRINYLDKRTDMSTITLALSPVAAPPLEPQSSWEPLKAAEKAWKSSLEMLGSATTALIAVSVFLWWLVPLALIGALIVGRARRKTVAAATEG